MGNLATPISVQRLQTALHAKAKEEPEFRFHALYDKIYRMDVLEHAYACCRANKGAPGIDGVTFEGVETYGWELWLGELAKQLRDKKYRPEAVRRVFIPKLNGKLRPLGIPRLADRVCQTAAMLVLGPIFDADMPSEQYAYRQNRNALDAVREVHGLLVSSHEDVVDADLSGYFDTIPHVELMKSVARRVVDRRVLDLLKMWLDAPVEGDDERGRKKRTTVIWLNAWRTLLGTLDERGLLKWDETFLDGSFAPAKKGLRSRQDQAWQGDEVDGTGRR